MWPICGASICQAIQQQLNFVYHKFILYIYMRAMSIINSAFIDNQRIWKQLILLMLAATTAAAMETTGRREVALPCTRSPRKPSASQQPSKQSTIGNFLITYLFTNHMAVHCVVAAQYRLQRFRLCKSIDMRWSLRLLSSLRLIAGRAMIGDLCHKIYANISHMSYNLE